MAQAQSLPNPVHIGKRLARLATIQALYQNNYAEQPIGEIIAGGLAQNFAFLRDEAVSTPDLAVEPDAELFGQIVSGVANQTDTLDEMLVGALDTKFSGNRMEILLRMILRAGVFELYNHTSIPSGVIINDYIDVTRAFFDGKESGLVNAVLDKLAGKLRA